jgi:hypothetical protein
MPPQSLKRSVTFQICQRLKRAHEEKRASGSSENNAVDKVIFVDWTWRYTSSSIHDYQFESLFKLAKNIIYAGAAAQAKMTIYV